ncbi:MAG: glycosyltransferase family 39 protein [Bacteroidales bacterium]|nr:glycosyltransferase family 39 protein [Bacteroidales bacterium]MCM1416871.1 glycosyltransferase family 39 protein [bacterium]MCM1424132.1 glycosyltransferase family 39 protein [bacterium]
MTYRKTWLSYVIWFFYACLCVMLLAVSGDSVYHIYAKAAPANLGVILIFPLLVCSYLALRQGSLEIRKRKSISFHSRQMIEAFCVSVSFVFGFLARLRMLLAYAAVLSSSGDKLSAGFMEKAFVRAGESVAPIAHGVSYLYVLMLSGVFSFLGNSAGAAIFLQIVLQLLAMLVAYRLIKAAAGRFAACVSLLLMAFSPIYVEMAADITPECLFLLLYLFGLSFAVFYVRAAFAGSSVFGKAPFAILPGAVIGILAYFELSAVTILFFFAVLFAGGKKEEQTAEIRKNILRLLAAVVSCVAAFFILIAADAALSGVSLERSLYVWAYPYMQAGFPVSRLGELFGNALFCAALFLPAAFLVFAFLKSGKEQDHVIWLFFCILFTPFLFWEIWTLELSGLALFFWSVAAALGIKNCLFGKEAEVMQAKIEEINAFAEPIPVPPAPAEPALEQKPRFLENPLPLPKKHIKREMDYDYAVTPEMMHFDVEPTEGDDFVV